MKRVFRLLATCALLFSCVKVVNHPVTYVHERRKAVLSTCDHAGYTAATCPYCKHD